MKEPQAIAQAYLETWNETDAQRRSALLRQHWTTQASYVDPLMQGSGEAGIAGLVGAVHQRFPGFRFTQIGTPDGHGDYVRLSWALGPEGQQPPIEGSDVVIVKDGRIDRVIGFIDRAPAAA